MRLLRTAAIAAMTLALARGDGKKDDGRFSPGPASSYSTKQTNENVTVAAIPYDTADLAHRAFGKLNPNEHGVLPVLVIIQNDTEQALRLDRLQTEYLAANRRVEATPPGDVRYLGYTPKRPAPNLGSPIPPGVFKKKNPLSAPEIEERAFAARMLPPHESASGFFYFQVGALQGSRLYLSGITVAATGNGLFYFEIPLDR